VINIENKAEKRTMYFCFFLFSTSRKKKCSASHGAGPANDEGCGRVSLFNLFIFDMAVCDVGAMRGFGLALSHQLFDDTQRR
jgi:hypothetical protein